MITNAKAVFTEAKREEKISSMEFIFRAPKEERTWSSVQTDTIHNEQKKIED
jgi:hypothetical protein